MTDHAERQLLPRPVPDFPCDTCGHRGIVHRHSGKCTAGVGCPCPGFHSDAAAAAYTEVLEARLRAVWAYLPELSPFVPKEALRPLYALTVLSSRPLRADDVERATAIAALGAGESV